MPHSLFMALFSPPSPLIVSSTTSVGFAAMIQPGRRLRVPLPKGAPPKFVQLGLSHLVSCKAVGGGAAAPCCTPVYFHPFTGKTPEWKTCEPGTCVHKEGLDQSSSSLWTLVPLQWPFLAPTLTFLFFQIPAQKPARRCWWKQNFEAS